MEEAVVEEELNEIEEIESLNTHNNILKNNGYKILSLRKNYASIMIEAKACERVLDDGAIYDGVLFSAATFAAIAAVNEKNVFLIGVHLDLLNPLKGEENIIFTAEVNATSSGKKVVKVTGRVNEIAFLEGDFMLLKLDEKSLIK